MTRPRSWADKLPKNKHESFMIDVYRMRVDDDLVWKKLNRGINCQIGVSMKTIRMNIIKDLVKFSVLAVSNECLVKTFDFKKFLKIAESELKNHFTKADAKAKYGVENIFNINPYKPSLREAIKNPNDKFVI